MKTTSMRENDEEASELLNLFINARLKIMIDADFSLLCRDIDDEQRQFDAWINDQIFTCRNMTKQKKEHNIQIQKQIKETEKQQAQVMKSIQQIELKWKQFQSSKKQKEVEKKQIIAEKEAISNDFNDLEQYITLLNNKKNRLAEETKGIQTILPYIEAYSKIMGFSINVTDEKVVVGFRNPNENVIFTKTGDSLLSISQAPLKIMQNREEIMEYFNSSQDWGYLFMTLYSIIHE